MSLQSRWAERAAALERDGLRRTLKTVQPLPDGFAFCDGRRVLNAASNDYLGLAEHPEIHAAMASGGSGSARLISGNRAEHHTLEAQLSEWLGKPTTLFTSGYAANVAVMSTLFGSEDIVASDALNHASIIDGLRLGKAKRVILPHGEAPASDASAWIVEGLYSMDGDRAPVTNLRSVPLVVDEAHAVGCIGPEGRGVAAAAGADAEIVVGTLGKAFGAAGAFVAGPPAVRELLVSAGRPFIFTTAMPAGVARAGSVGLRLATEVRRERLRENVVVLRDRLRALGITALGQDHIVPVVTGAASLGIAAHLANAGFLVGAVRYPTVARGSERLRITVSAAHRRGDLIALAEALAGALFSPLSASMPPRVEQPGRPC